MAFKGIDIRQTSDRLVFRALLQDDGGDLLATGTTTLKVYELQSDGTLKSYDFNDDTFKTTALTTETLAMTHRAGNNGTTNTGLWTASVTTLAGFAKGNIYFAMVNNAAASPKDQQREFQFGSVEGDMTVNGSNHLDVNVKQLSDDAPAADSLELFVEALGTDDKPLLSADSVLLHITPLIPGDIDLANTAPVRVGFMLTNALDDLPSVAEISPGTVTIDRKAEGGTTWLNIVTDAACSESAGLIYDSRAYGAAALFARGDSIRFTFKNQKVTVGGNDYEITGSGGRILYSSIRQATGGAAADAIADAVLDELVSGHTTAGSVGAELHLVKAMLANKRTHTISTGVDQVMDDDGSTLLRTMTPTDDGDDSITVDPS